MLYFEWTHEELKLGLFSMPFKEFLLDRNVGFTPVWFGLWATTCGSWAFFLLFLTLPICLWLNRESGKAWTFRLAGFCQRRGAILIFALPLAALRLVLHRFFPEEHSWADFFVLMGFYLYGYILFSNQEFLQVIRRDWWLYLVLGIAAIAARDWPRSPIWLAGGLINHPSIFAINLFWLLVSIDGWCMVLFFLYVGMRFLDFTNRYLEYGREAILPFFVFHQPVIIIVGFFVVQWAASLWVKLPVVVLGSFVVTLGIYELLVRRVNPLRQAFGMKTSRGGSRPAPT